MNLLLLFAFSQAVFAFSQAAGRLSGDLFRALFNKGHDVQDGHKKQGEPSTELKGTSLNDEFTRNTLSFAHGKDCHSVMTKEFGEFSFPMQQNHKHGNIWCNWIIWVGPKRYVIVNITGFVSKEDCTTNQDAIIFHGIASTVEGTVIRACSNQNIHLFATRAVAVHVVYLLHSSTKKKAETSFHGSYYTFEDFEEMQLKYPSLSLVKELRWQNFSEPPTRLTNDPMRSVVTVPLKGQDTGGTKAVTLMMENSYSSDLLIHKLRSTKVAKSSTAATSNKGNQISFEMFTTHVAESDFYVSGLEHAMSSTITSRTGLSTSAVQNGKEDASTDVDSSSKNGVGHATWSNMLSLLHGVKPTTVGGAFHQGFNSIKTATGSEVLTFDRLLQNNITIHNELSEKSFRLSTGLDKKYDLLYTSQSKVAFLNESSMEKPVPTHLRAISDVSSQTVSPYLQVGGSLKDGKWSGTKSHDDRDSTKRINKNDLLLSSIAPNSMSEQKTTGLPTRTYSPHLDMFTSRISPQLLFTKEKGHTTQESEYSNGAHGGVKVSPPKHKYGPSLHDRHENSVLPINETISKLVPKPGKKNRRKIPLFKDGRKNRTKNGREPFELGGMKNESVPETLDYSKINSTINSPLRVVKALNTPTSETKQTLVEPPPQVSQRHTALQGAEAVMVLIGSDHERGDMEGLHAASTFRSQDMITVDGQHREDPFDRVAASVALENNPTLKNRHNPGDTLFALAIAIEHRGTLQNEAKVREKNFLHSIKEKIKEKLHHSSSHLNEIKLQHFQRTRAFNAVLTLWIHLRPDGKNLHYYKSQLKTLGDISSVNGKFALVSLSVEDVDECASGIELCGEAADCANEMGTYACKCKRGYEAPSADTLGATCVLSQPAGQPLPFAHLEILIGASLGVVLLLLLTVVVLCVFVKKRQVKRTVCLDSTSPATNDAIVQPGTTQPSVGHTSINSERVACRKFPVVQLADAGRHAPGQSCSPHLTKVTLEQSPCL